MEEEIKYIKKVEINKLWGYEDLNFVWNLNPDVNILAGDNGSGKSTVLNLIAGVLTANPHGFTELADTIHITFDTNETQDYLSEVSTVNEIKEKANKDKNFENLLNQIDNVAISNENQKVKFTYVTGTGDSSNAKRIYFTKINTFDQPFLNSETVQKLTNNEVKTLLDFSIFEFQKKYLDYQINIGNRAIEALKSGENNISKIDAKKTLFLDTIDTLFSHTQKKIDRTKNEITFIQRGSKAISPYLLSSGEKQMLVILLATLVMDNKPFIMAMDEPEISLHTDWQENLIDNIRKLNENVQIIIATHSPSIVINGWKDKVFEMSEIQVKN